MSAIEHIGVVLLVVLVVGGVIAWIVDAQQKSELERSKADTQVQIDRRAGEERLYESELRLIRIKVGPIAESTWRAKEDQVVNCIMSGEYGERCRKLMGDWRAFMKKVNK